MIEVSRSDMVDEVKKKIKIKRYKDICIIKIK